MIDLRIMESFLDRARSAGEWQCPIGLFYADTTGDMTWGSAKWREMTGLVTPSTEGWLCSVHTFDRAQTAAAWRRAVANATGYEGEYRPKAFPSTWLKMAAAPTFNIVHRMSGYSGVLYDITGFRARIEAALGCMCERGDCSLRLPR